MRNNSTWLKDGLSGLHAAVSDYNNDGFNDVTFVSATAARGANEIRRLFVYDAIKDSLVFIKNSKDYPNLRYNEELDCIDAFLVYGGSSTAFLRIDGDSLKEFARVDLMDGITTSVYDENNARQIIHRDSSFVGGYIRFKNFAPLEVNEDNW